MTQRIDAVRVLVFAKAPRPGEVKTRLEPLLGRDGAAALHARFIEKTLRIATDAKVGPVELYGAPAEDAFLQSCAARTGINLLEQSAGDLGTRMHRALDTALQASRAAILIGTDCPALTADHLQQAAHTLAHGNDAVFVPVEDGGYVLVGLRHAHVRLFDCIAWSTPTVMAETRQRMRDLDWSWCELETLWDVDRPADYERLIAKAPDFTANSTGAPASYIG